MIKALIVDDDFLVRMFLKQLIDWENEGFELVGDACNGIEALALIEQLNPELIITDLSMPGMGGIELIEQARLRLPDSYIIALSCHGEFEYVKEAMKRGANEYVLKNLLDAPGLTAQLEIARRKLFSAARRAEQTDKLRQLAAKGTELLRFELLQSLLQEPLPAEEQARRLREVGVDSRFYTCAALAVTAKVAKSGALSQVCVQFCRNKPAFCLSYDDNTCYILLDLSAIASEPAQCDWANAFAEALDRCIREYLNVCPGLGVSAVQSSAVGLHEAVCQARSAMAYTFYEPGVHSAAELLGASAELPEEALAMLRRLPSMADEGLFERICEDGLRVLRLCRDKRAQPEEVRRWFGELLQIAGAGGEPPRTLDECADALSEITQRLAEERGAGGGNRAIKQAAAYLRANFAKPLSLATVATEVHLNPAYLSYLFKREMGVNFSDFLLECRMEHMKLLLRESGDPLKECAVRAGFADYRNFCKLFKKLTGLRPAQYRSLNRLK